MLIFFHKPFGVLSQFTSDGSPNRPLADFGFPKAAYRFIGRLERADSEGLLLLSDEAELNARLLQPRMAHARVYWVQVEGIPAAQALRKLELRGNRAREKRPLPCRAWGAQPAASGSSASILQFVSANLSRIVGSRWN